MSSPRAVPSTITTIYLQGTKSLYAKREYVTSTGRPKIIDENVYPLREVTPEELLSLRISRVPGFVFKTSGTFYYTEIPHDLNCAGIIKIGEHLCADCARCHANSDQEGGCRKVRNLFVNPDNVPIDILPRVISASKRIEKYQFITCGYQSFNTESSLETFVVMICNDCLPDKNKK